jgi:hypothetical protein
MIFIPTTSTTICRRAFEHKSNATVTFVDVRHRDCRLIPPAEDEFRRIAGSGYGGERPASYTSFRRWNGDEKHPQGVTRLVASSVSALPSPVDKSFAAAKKWPRNRSISQNFNIRSGHPL